MPTGQRVSHVSDFGSGALDQTAVLAAVEALKDSAGHPQGHLVIDAPVRLVAPTVLDLGYRNVRFASSGLATATSRNQPLRVTCLAPFTADPGLGNALTVRGGFGPILDLAFDGGGAPGDNALHLEDLLGLELVRLTGARYAGTLLHADGTAGTALRVSQATVGYLYADSCGRLLSLSGIEGFGRIEKAWDVACQRGSEFVNCADIGLGHWESWTPASQDYGLDFRGCNNFHVGLLSLGDRPSQAMVRVQGGDFGSISKLRASGQPGTTAPTTRGLVLDGVDSIEVDLLHTFRTAVGLDITGGGSHGLRVKRHFSMTGDVNPLRITGGAPRVVVDADYRYHQGASVVIGPNTGGQLKLSGHLTDMYTPGSATGKYVIDVDSSSGATVLDVAGLEQVRRNGLRGLTNHPAPATIRGLSGAYLGNGL